MQIKHRYNQIKYYFQTYGLLKTIKKVIVQLFCMITRREMGNDQKYQVWIKKNEPNEAGLTKQRETKFAIQPKISFIVPMYQTPLKFFEQLVEALLKQTYSNWELCLADGSPEKNPHLEKIVSKDDRIKYQFLEDNKGISGNTNEALKLATGDFLALLDHDDLIPEFCAYEIVKCINENPEVEFIYTDEDKIQGKKEIRKDPYFKPDFSIDTLRANNYITHLSIFKKELMDKLGGFKEEYNGAQDFDIILRASEETNQIVHIPKVLYHWRVHPASTAMDSDAKPYAYQAGQRAISDHLQRQGLQAKVTPGGDIPGIYEVMYEVIGNPKVSIIIPNKDSVKLLKNCIDSIVTLSTYSNYEILIIENNSEEKATFEYYETIQKNEKVKVILYPETGFNYSKIINFGVQHSEAEYVMQLNSDTEILTPNWLEKFIGFAQREDVGAVGARLYYEDKSIQHAGIVVGIGGLAANMLSELPKGVHAYFGKDCLTQNMSAVTGACLFSRRTIYEEVGYMDEEHFKVAFNDVDFCLKIREKGYKIIYHPYIELMHYESKTRGYENTPEKKARFEKESNSFHKKWKTVIDQGDPYYNPNLSLTTAKYDIKM